MTRPTVLIATTNPVMAYALKKRFKEPCRELGLRLDVCPDGDESDVGEQKERAYNSTEALFDALEKRNPMELADTLVVLDVGVELEKSFSCAVTGTSDMSGWHVKRQRRAGVAVELLLRFPQVFPVFLSPAVPVLDKVADKERIANENDRSEVIEPTWRDDLKEGEWGCFFRLRNEVCTKHKSGQPELEACKSLHAFQIPLHFVSPLDGGAGLASTLARFARGMRCWFDPTGLRTLVRNRFLGTVFGNKFGNKEGWENIKKQREVLLNRLQNVCIAVDEEREFALLNAYTAYKFGRRAWLVTTYAEFDDKPLWVYQKAEPKENNVVVLRDIDLRFPDNPENASRGTGSVRVQLMSVYSPTWLWLHMDREEKVGRLGKEWVARVVSSNSGVESEVDFGKLGQNQENLEEEAISLAECQEALAKLKMLSQSDDRDRKISECEKKLSECEKSLKVAISNLQYQGLKKPIGSLYDLSKLLNCAKTVAADLEVDSGVASSGGHGAPYLNLAMAESLLQQSRRFNREPVENLLGALLAGEAYELLLGMSQTTALEALLLQHKHEVMAEVEFPGVSHAISIKGRQKDVEAVLRQHMQNNNNLPMKNMFLSQFWSELKVAYRDGEQFTAAEAANVRSLVHDKWLTKWLPCWPEWDWLDKGSLFVKTWVVNVATSLGWWVGASMLLIVAAWIGYLWVSCDCYFVKLGALSEHFTYVNVDRLFLDAVLSSITLQPMGLIDTERECSVGTLVVIAHLGFAYVLFGLLISMLYRKVTRS